MRSYKLIIMLAHKNTNCTALLFPWIQYNSTLVDTHPPQNACYYCFIMNIGISQCHDQYDYCDY